MQKLSLLSVLIGYAAAYSLSQTFQGNNFFGNFDFFTGDDPTHGYVNFVSQSQAQQSGLIAVNGNAVYIGSDHTNKASGRGRDSIRMQTKQSYNTGLFVMDLSHMPEGCSTWPAWWLVGPNWPNGGEIDIIEGVNTQATDATTLHTKNGCSMSGENHGLFSGTMSYPNCYVSAGGQPNNAGCGIQGLGGSYGSAFNGQGGGVYALEWTNGFIRAFFFTHGQVPGDINSGSPNPNNWGKPYAYFELGNNCPSNYFSNMNLVFDLTFCGDWAGAVFGSQCPNKGSCQSYVQNTPGDFKNAYWEVNWIKIFH